MIKNYTQQEYAEKAIQANEKGQMLYVLTHKENNDVILNECGNDPTAPAPASEESIKDTSGDTLNMTNDVIFADLIIAPVNYYICYNGNYTDGTINPNYDREELQKAKTEKNDENTTKAKLAIENGYVEFKNAQFETNAQTVSDLTATMLMLQAQSSIEQAGISSLQENNISNSESSGINGSGSNFENTSQNLTPEHLPSVLWLSKDDVMVELTLEDFATLGSLIAQFKNTVWNEKYIGFKNAIENAKTPEDVKAVKIVY